MDYSLPAQSNTASYRELFGAVRRQRWLIAATVAAFAAMGLGMSFLTKPQYMSSRTVVVQGRTQQFNTPAQDPLQNLQVATQEDLPTQIEVLQSQAVLATVLARLSRSDADLTPPEPGDPNVVARQVAGTNSVEIQVFSSNPRLAQEVASGIPEAFSDYVKTNRRKEVQRTITNLSDQLKSEQDSLTVAQKRLDNFRSDNRLSASTTEAAELSQQLQRAENDQIQANANMASQAQVVSELLLQRKSIPPTIPDPSQQTNNPQIQQANDALARFEQDRDQLLVQYESDAPQVQEQNAKIEAQKRYISRIPKTLSNQGKVRNPLLQSSDAGLADAKGRLAGAKAEAASKKKSLADLQERAQKYNLLQAKLSDLNQDIDRRKQSVSELQSSYNRVNPLRDAVGEPVTELSAATPAVKSKPNPPLYLALSIVLGALVAGVIALMREKMLDRVNTLDDAYRIADVPALGYIPPRIFGRNAKKTGKLPTRVMENYRIVRSNVLYSSREHPFRSLMVTSTGRGEGKSEVAANLAIAMASSGKRVLLVDSHLHSPSVHERFNVSISPGLSEVLLDQADLVPSIQSTEIDGLQVLTAGERKVSLADGLGGGGMTRVHEQLIQAFDMVIFDTAPMLPRSDSLGLSSTVETVVYVVKPGETTKTLLRYCLELLRHAHARLLGVVFTNTEFYEEAV
ncbi:polysaccharide biosynthesis tyrosine autokinase [soil metagenome]